MHLCLNVYLTMDASLMQAGSITRIAALIGEPGRIQMLTALLDGKSHSASELALAAVVSPQTASSHLSKLLSGGLIISERSGRQRLFRLKNADVAVAVEALGALAQPSNIRSVPELRLARSCYDHLAGMLAIAVRNELLKNGALRHHSGDFSVTPKGKKVLRTLEIDVDSLLALRRSFAHKCLDWTERHPHIGGALGAALLGRFIERKWLARIRETRALRITHTGEREFERTFNIRCAALRPVEKNSNIQTKINSI
jgi:DNA-binding transcriptional ArsR family regulator